MKANMIIKRAALLLTLSGMAAFTLSARAQIWYAPTPITLSGSNDVLMDGTLVAAWNLTQTNIGDRVINGVTFTAAPYNSQPDGLTIAGSGLNATDMYFHSVVVSTTGYYGVLGSGYYLGSVGTPMALTLSNLTIGTTYQVKFWVNDPRVNSNGRYLTFYTDGVSSGNINVSQGVTPETSNYGNLVVCEFTAASASQLFAIEAGGAAGANAFLNALALSVIPEPSTWALLLTGAAALMVSVRRRK